MKTNRAMRDKIEQRLGSGTREELARWNDLSTDSLEDYGIELTSDEEVRQAAQLDQLVTSRSGSLLLTAGE